MKLYEIMQLEIDSNWDGESDPSSNGPMGYMMDNVEGVAKAIELDRQLLFYFLGYATALENIGQHGLPDDFEEVLHASY